MSGFFSQMGPWAYLLWLGALGLLAQLVLVLLGRGGSQATRRILALGGGSAVLGIVGTFTGAYLAMGAIARAQSISPQIVFQGVQVALSTSIFGFSIFFFSLVAAGLLQPEDRREREV